MTVSVETSVYHASADEPLLRLLEDDVTPQRYVDYLVAVYGFEAPLEGALWYTRSLNTILDLRRHCRSGLIAQDLLFLGVEPTQITELPAMDLLPFGSPAEALGWMYVAERTTRLHERVREHLVAAHPMLGRASAYLEDGHGAIGARWHALGQAMDRVANTGDVRMIVNAARAAFARLAGWHRSTSARQLKAG
jgi:heme oxygenase